MNYSGNEVKTWVKRVLVKSFVLAMKIRFWVIYSSFPGVFRKEPMRLWLNWIEQLTTDQ